MKKAIVTTAAPGAIGPYSQAIEYKTINNSMLFASGQIPINPETGEIPEGITAQTEQSLKNVCAILDAAGLSVADVIKTTVYLTDMSNFGAMNEVYGRVFTEPYPARSAVAVRELPKGVLVEIEVIAAHK